MSKVRSFVRWMLIDPRHPELAQAQYNALKTQIPALYFLLMVNAVAVSYTHFDVAPVYLTVGVLVPMLAVTSLRLVAWLRAGKISLGPDEAISKMRQTIVLGSVIAVVYIAWSLSLDGYGGPHERGHVALFIAITVIGCVFCLMNLPQAAILVMVIVTVPYLVYYVGLDQDVYFAIALNILLVFLVVLKVLLNGYSGFCKLIRSQEALAAKQRETQSLSEENRRLAHTDALTGLPNRRYFFNRLAHLIEDDENTERRFAVGVLDLDRFKPVNDTYGHKLGDQLLAEVGDRLKSLNLPDMEVCRLGGDEFGFLFTGDPASAAKVGQTVCDHISKPYRFGELQLTIGASCGIAVYPEAGRSAHELFDRSDYALYNSKSSSRGRATIYSKSHEAKIRSERAIESALQSADLTNEFKVYFQPVVSIPERTVVGFEALVRWHSPVLEEVEPDQFIAIAERTGLINRLTISLFEKATRQIKSLPGDLYLSFNLSAHDITSPETVAALLEIIHRYDFDPRLITFEITETSVIGSYEAAESCLRKLRNAGVRLALDDFGTGYSSLGYLHRLPIDCVKIDRSFVSGISEQVAGDVITSIVNLCRSMQMACIVEGVEKSSQLEVLETLECRLAQGFFFAPALPFDEVYESAHATKTVAGLPLSGFGANTELRRSSA
ncbi:putative bifunctional diguanylate cyclase/phosphodiesterase [Roseibium sp. SCP14]|uniref:putative bifunctional diguanylate cyclase/phosphodiesterase n=1 Tax=Roseibium sp. SCP14 TaxID=3141375 RepID=UPI00333C8A89